MQGEFLRVLSLGLPIAGPHLCLYTTISFKFILPTIIIIIIIHCMLSSGEHNGKSTNWVVLWVPTFILARRTDNKIIENHI